MIEPALAEDQGVQIDIDRVMQMIPHRHPFLMIDRVIDCVPNQHATGIKNVSINSKFSSSPMTPASIIRLMSSTVNARRGNPSAALVMATFMMRTGFRSLCL